MKKRFLFYFLILILVSTASGLAQIPAGGWERWAAPEEAGFSSERLELARALYDSLDGAAFMVVYDGRVLVTWGDIYRRFMCHSVRKSLMSALYGTFVEEGTIDLDRTMAELGIDDISPLTETEKEARIRDLLKARSGVYHPAAYETAGMKAARPARGSHTRDTFWYYNNWDFNVLCTILEQHTGRNFFVDFYHRIAAPIGMEDYRMMDGYHHLESEHSMHSAYPFKLSARDMARIGLLFLRNGKWGDRRIIPESWIRESTRPYSDTGGGGERAGYGYLWWTTEDPELKGMYSALGVGTQMISVLPLANMVIVQRVNTYEGHRVRPNMRLFKMVLAAKVASPKTRPRTIPLEVKSEIEGIAGMTPAQMVSYVGPYANEADMMRIALEGGSLILRTYGFGNYRLLPMGEDLFFVEDLEQIALIGRNESGEPSDISLHRTRGLAEFVKIINDKGAEEGLAWYSSRAENRRFPPFSEADLNALGYVLLRQDRIDEGIQIFKLNAEAYPESFNVYDSLGEAYLIKGEKEAAIRSYEKSLELNPGNENGREMLKRLREKE